jgi:hypothetical protein
MTISVTYENKDDDYNNNLDKNKSIFTKISKIDRKNSNESAVNTNECEGNESFTNENSGESGYKLINRLLYFIITIYHLKE